MKVAIIAFRLPPRYFMHVLFYFITNAQMQSSKDMYLVRGEVGIETNFYQGSTPTSIPLCQAKRMVNPIVYVDLELEHLEISDV